MTIEELAERVRVLEELLEVREKIALGKFYSRRLDYMQEEIDDREKRQINEY